MTTSTEASNPRDVAPDDEVTLLLPTGVGIAMAVVAVIIGFLILKLPIATLVVIAVLFGINLIFLGAFRIALGVGRKGVPGWVRGLTVAFGAITFVFGIICLASPGVSLGVLALLLAIGWISDGLSAIIDGVLGRRDRSRSATAWSIVAGIISIIAGLVVAVAPGASLVTLTQFSGFLVIVLGVMYLITAIAYHLSRSRTRG